MTVKSSTTVTSVAGVVPKETALVPDRWVPVMVTVLPPAGVPVAGLMAVTAGGAWAVSRL